MGLLKSKISKEKESLAPFFSGVSSFFSKKKKTISLASGEMDKKLVYSLSKSKMPSWQQIKYVGRVLTPKEFLTVKIFSFLIILSLGFLGFNFYHKHLKTTPVLGGKYTEGLVGAPQRINPLYSSINDADADISRLIFSSLFKFDVSGNPEKDLVDDYQISDDGKTYTFKIKSGAHWQDGNPLTVEDVFFTFQAIKDPAYNSPLKPSFTGIEAKIEGDNTIIFTLPEKYAPFLNLLTFGVMPAKIWGQIPPQSAPLADLNLRPIGSGAYKVKSWSKDKSGNIKIYNLTVNDDYYGKKPYIKDLVFKFFGNFTEAINALNNGETDGLSYLPKNEKSSLVAKSSLNLNKLAMPKIKAIFFNGEKNPALYDLKVRQALAYVSPREKIINDILGSEASPAYGPIPSESFAYNPNLEKYDFNLEKSTVLLSGAGWKKDNWTEADITALKEKEDKATSTSALTEEEKMKIAWGAGQWLFKEELIDKKDKKNTKTKRTYLSISLTVLDDEESANTARLIMQAWEQLGIKVSLDLVSVSQVQASVIKPRNYEAILFSELLGNDPDSYFFWHSSQAGEGGLNLSNYKNEEADKLLEEGRVALTKQERIDDYQKFQAMVNQDAAAIFLYSPFYTYPQGKRVKNFGVKTVATPADRFADINEWYVKTGQRFVW